MVMIYVGLFGFGERIQTNRTHTVLLSEHRLEISYGQTIGFETMFVGVVLPIFCVALSVSGSALISMAYCPGSTT